MPSKTSQFSSVKAHLPFLARYGSTPKIATSLRRITRTTAVTKRRECQRVQLCNDKPNFTKRCSACNNCNQICSAFEEEVCYKLFESPYVCNGCPDEYRCVLQKRYYLHKQAHEAYRELLIEARVGANITEDELLDLDGTISSLIKRGQSVHHIFANNPDRFNISEKSVYRYVAGGLLTAGKP